MANTIQIKRHSSNTDTSAPSSLVSGELALSQAGKKLYVGRHNNSSVEVFHLPTLQDLTAGAGVTGTVSSGSDDNSVTVAVDLTDSNMGIAQARYAVISVAPIAIILAWYYADDALSVFRIFLVADLFAAATVLPIFLSLSDRVTANGGLVGAVFGLISVVIYGIFISDLETGIDYLTNPINENGLANLGVFLSALIGSALVTIIVSEIENNQS